MRPAPFDYEAPDSIDAAAEMLSVGPLAVVLAGGQTLVPQMIRRAVSPLLVVDINRVAEMRRVSTDADGATGIGALVRHEELLRSPELRSRLPVLAEAASYVSNPVVRRRGTVGGSIAWRDGRSEIAAAFLACNADLIVHSSETGSRRIAIADALAPGSAALRDGDLITEVVVPGTGGARQSWGVAEVSARRWDPAVGGAVCRIVWQEAGAPAAVNVVAFGELNGPRRLEEVEESIAGGTESATIGDAARREVAAAVSQRAGSGDPTYTAAVVGDSVRRAVDAARTVRSDSELCLGRQENMR